VKRGVGIVLLGIDYEFKVGKDISVIYENPSVIELCCIVLADEFAVRTLIDEFGKIIRVMIIIFITDLDPVIILTRS
jgi:hypothetical protein